MGANKKLYGWYSVGEAWLPVKVDSAGKVVINPTNSGIIVYTDTRSKTITAMRDLAAAAGAVAYTGVGFKPTSIQALAILGGTFSVCMGFADSVKAGQCIATFVLNSWTVYGALMLLYDTAGANQFAQVISYDADGFTLTWVKTGLPTGTFIMKLLCSR